MDDTPNLARSHVSLDRIRPGPAIRSGLDDAHIARIADVADRWPPVVLQTGTYVLIDGAHRIEAARRNGATTIEADFVDLDDGELLAVRAERNSAHGLTLSLDERRAIAFDLLAQQRWSDGRIADATGLNRSTITRYREKTIPGGADHDLETGTRQGKDGKHYPRDATARRERALRTMAENPDRPLTTVAEQAGLSLSTIYRLRDQQPGPTRTDDQAHDAEADQSPERRGVLAQLISWLVSLLTGLLPRRKSTLNPRGDAGTAACQGPDRRHGVGSPEDPAGCRARCRRDRSASVSPPGPEQREPP